MAESIVSDVVVKLLEYMGKSAFQEIAPYFGGKRKLKQLEHTMEMIQARLVDAERRGEGEGEQLIKKWLQRLKRILFRLENLLQEITMVNKLTKPITRLIFSTSNPLKVNKKVAKEAKAIMEELNAITSLMLGLGFREVNPIGEQYVVNIDSSRETHSFVLEEEVIGREDEKHKIVEMLLNNSDDGNLSVIPIVGIGGLGKTTLAQLVYNDKNVEKHFELRCWACISDISSLHELAGKILRSISGGEYCQLSLEQIQSQLRQGIDGKRYLLVFDDIWDEDRKRWLELRRFLHGGKHGSKIIVTSRSKVVAQNMGTIEPFELKGLKDDKSWDLFKKLAFKEHQEDRNPNLTRIGKEIINKCANVPLAIKTIACLLYSMDTESEWEAFKDKELRTIEQNENSILLTLKLSYDRLPSQLKQCFAYCSLFPKDHLFEKQDLIYLWMAQGFLRPADGQCPEDVGHGYIMQLKRRCFFHDAVKNYHNEVLSYSMHDLVHDLAQLVAGGETILVDEPYKQQINDNVCHVSFCSSLEETPSWLLAAKQLRSFLHLHGATRINFAELFTSLTCLRVLYLAESKSIPDSLGELKHLRYLKLGGRHQCLPECITKLQNLQTLDLGDCEGLRQLPRGLAKLINLRRLHFHHRHTYLIDIPPEFGKLTSLQALDIFVVGENNGLDALANLNHLGGSLKVYFRRHNRSSMTEITTGILKNTKLIELILVGDVGYQGSFNELEVKCLEFPPSLKRLKVCCWEGVRFPSWKMDELPCLLPNLVSIDISDCIRCQYLPPFSRLPCLRSLRLSNLKVVEYIEIGGHKNGAPSTDVVDYFPSLESLCLERSPELKAWSSLGDDTTHPQNQPFFPRLSELSIQCCPNLKSMPLVPKLQSLTARKLHVKLVKHLVHELQESLTTLRICSVTELEAMSINLRSLKELNIEDFPNLIKLTAISSTSASPLQVLDIQQCDKLTDISDILQHLTNLEKLTVEDALLGSILDDNSKRRLKNLRWLDLPKLGVLPESIGHLTQLQTLIIMGCSEFTALPESFGNLKLLRLNIGRCPGLTALPESFRKLTSLQFLQIWDCPELQRRCEKFDGQDWPLIQHIPRVVLGT